MYLPLVFFIVLTTSGYARIRVAQSMMARLVIQQSQERLRKLTVTADEIMQSGISLAEDLTVSIYVSSTKSEGEVTWGKFTPI